VITLTELFIVFITVLVLAYFPALIFLKKGITKTVDNGLHNSKEKKSVSVVICARNEEKNLPALFSCLEKQITDQRKVEFIIVNDRSEDNTATIIENQLKKDVRFKAIHISEKTTGFGPKKYAIDCAIKKAAGEIILLTDADGRPGDKWLQSISAYFDKSADMVIGYAPYSIKSDDGFIKKILALEYFSHAAIAAATCGVGYPVTCVGTNMAYLKKVYEEIGGFGKYKAFVSGDDDLFLTLVREQCKYKIFYALEKSSHVYNAPPKSFNQFVQQRLRYASKGFNYPLKVTASLTLYVLFNLALLGGFIFGLLDNNPILWSSFGVLFLKAFFEFYFLNNAARILDDKRFLKYYFVTSIFHIPYVLFFGILGQFQFYKWAEKSAEPGIIKN